MQIHIVIGGGSGECDPYANADGFENPCYRHSDEMALRGQWDQQFEKYRDDNPIHNAPGMILQAGTSGVIPGFQG